MSFINQPSGQNFILQNQEDNETQLGRYEFNQRRLPLSSSLYMNNFFGTHNPALSRFANFTNLISRRFNVAEIDMLGAATQLVYNNTNTLSLSTGYLGLSQGALLPNFNKSDGRINRAQFAKSLRSSLLTLDYWNTYDYDEEDLSTNGYRFSFNSAINSSWVTSFSSLGNDENMALIAGAEQRTDLFRGY